MKNLMFADWMTYTYAGDWKEEVDGKSVFVEPKVDNETTFTIHRKTVNPEFVYTVTDLNIYPKHIVSKYEGDIKDSPRRRNSIIYLTQAILGHIVTRNG